MNKMFDVRTRGSRVATFVSELFSAVCALSVVAVFLLTPIVLLSVVVHFIVKYW